jgi:hypothetical protein
MITCPEEFLKVIIPFAKLFSKSIFSYVKLMLAAAILAPARER